MSASANRGEQSVDLTLELGRLANALLKRHSSLYPLFYEAMRFRQEPTQRSWDRYCRVYWEKKEVLKEYERLVNLKDALKVVLFPVVELQHAETLGIMIPQFQTVAPPPPPTTTLLPPQAPSQEKPPVVYQMVDNERLPARKRLREVSPSASSTDSEEEEVVKQTDSTKKRKTVCGCCGEPSMRVTTCGRTSVHPCRHPERCVNRPKKA